MTTTDLIETPAPVGETPAPVGHPAAGAPAVLVVDDSRVSRLVIGRMLQKHGEWQTAFAADGVEALEAIERFAPRAVLTDLQMPRMNGLELVERVRERFPHIPVLLMTGEGSEEVAIAALRAGAASYVPKRTMDAEIVPILRQVLAASHLDATRARLLGGLTARTSDFVLENDPALVAPLIEMFREDLLAIGVCDPTSATRVGIALEEALLNAVYHGNLDISSDLKQIGDGTAFHRMAAARRYEAPYHTRRVRVAVRLTPAQGTFVISDEGTGFDVAALPDPTDPANLERPSGRGVLLMRTFMDEVTYNATGNEVTLCKKRELYLPGVASHV